MSESKALSTDKQFKQDVAEYQSLERKIAEGFLNGIVQLGEVLSRARDTWKDEGRWMEYVESIGRNQAGVSQMIRMYEYSKKNMKQLLKAGIDNWAKANMFLALPNEVRTELANEVGGDKLTTEEFADKVDLVKEEHLPEVEVVKDSDLIGIESTPELAKLLDSATLADINFAAREVRKELNKQGMNFSVQCVPTIEVYLTLVRALETVTGEEHKRLSLTEKRYWNKMIRNMLAKIDKGIS